MRESLGGKPKGVMKVNLHARHLCRSMTPSRSLAMGRRQSVCAETRKMVNYSRVFRLVRRPGLKLSHSQHCKMRREGK